MLDFNVFYDKEFVMTKIHKLALSLLVGLYAMPVAYSNTAGANKATAPAPVQEKKAALAPSLNPSFVTYDKFNTEVRVGARVKADFYNDLHGKQGGSTFGLDPAAIPLNRWDYDAMRHHHFNTSLAGSRISLDVSHKFGEIQSYGYIETDFAGAVSSSTRTSNNYGIRVRNAFGEVSDANKVNSFLIGQTWSNFVIPEAYTITNNNLFPSLRQAQIRYTRKLTPEVSVGVAIERPNTQTYYYAVDGTAPGVANNVRTSYVDNDTAGGFNKSAMPDFTLNLRYQKETTLFALRGVVRRLDVKAIGTGVRGIMGQGSARDNFFAKKTAWGLGATTMFRIAKPLGFMFQVQGGNGIGRYIDELGNSNPFDSYFQYPAAAGSRVPSLFQTIKAINFLGGFTITWRDNLESNVGAAYTKISLPKNINLVNPVSSTGANNNALINTRLQRYHANLIYTIVPKTFAVFEVEQYYRNAGYKVNYKGKDTRLMCSFIRNF